MSKATINLLKDCARDLQEVRAQLPDNLGPGVIELLESVLQRLEQCESAVDDRAALIALIDDGLRLVGRLGEVALVIAEVVGHCRG
jgi:hypothetical protein